MNPPYSRELPFDADYFHPIINWHAGYYPPALKRIITGGGLFITQQVGSLSASSLIQSLVGRAGWRFSGIRVGEDISFTRLSDLGAVLFFLKALPWLVEDFSVKAYTGPLYDLHLRIEKKGYLDVVKRRFFLSQGLEEGKCKKRRECMWTDSIVFFGSSDLEQTHQFYHGHLTLPLERDQGLCRIYRVVGGGGLGFCTHMPVVHQEKSPILTLITPDVDGVYRRLEKAQVTLLHEPQENPTFGIYHFFLKDPDGYMVEVQRFLHETA